MTLHNHEREFQSADEYFEYISEYLGSPNYHKYFATDTTVSDGLELHIDIYEYDKSAPTIVFIPGTSIYSMAFAEILLKLGLHGYNIVGFDPRGHGRSHGKKGDYTINEIVRDTEVVVDYAISRFNERVSVLGSSQGGIAAFYYAALENKAQSVICQNFADLTWYKTQRLARFPGLVSFSRPFLLPMSDWFPSAQVPVSFYLDLGKIKIDRFGSAKKLMKKDPFALETISLRALRSLSETRLPVRANKISTPIMVFQGDQDSIFSVEYTTELYNKLTCDKQLQILPGLNHALMFNEPDQVIPVIIDWLTHVYPEHTPNREIKILPISRSTD